MLPNRTVRPEIMDSVALMVVDAQSAFIDTLPQKDAFLRRCAFAIEVAKLFQLLRCNHPDQWFVIDQKDSHACFGAG